MTQLPQEPTAWMENEEYDPDGTVPLVCSAAPGTSEVPAEWQAHVTAICQSPQ